MKRLFIAGTIVILFIIILVLLIARFQGKPLTIHTDKALNHVDTELEDILYYASLAPSSHNMQSWQVEVQVNEQRMNLSIDETRTLDVVDPRNKELYISLGCYLETLVTAFQSYGYNTEVFVDNESEKITIAYQKVPERKINIEKLAIMQKRHADKSKYKHDPLDAHVLSKLRNDLDGIYYYEANSSQAEYLKTKTLEAITMQSAMQDYRDELNFWMRFSDEEVRQKKDGISAEMIGLQGIAKTFYYWTINHQNASSDTFAKQGNSIAANQVNHCSGFVVVTGNNTFSGWIDAGRRTQAFWLKCTENNIAVQPISAILELAPFCDNVQEDLGLDNSVQMILRVGYVDDYGKNVGVRRDLHDYVEIMQ